MNDSIKDYSIEEVVPAYDFYFDLKFQEVKQ